MGQPQKRKKYHAGDMHLKKQWRTKRRTKDLDQIEVDLGEGQVGKLLKQDVDFDKPGLAQFYCVHCAKHFISGDAFKSHAKSKPHKRRLHALKTEPYTVEESLRAAGMGSYVKPLKRKMETLIPEAVSQGESLADVKKRAKLDEDAEAAAEDSNAESDDNSDQSEDEDGDKRM
jgi:bud site selection protein 20